MSHDNIIFRIVQAHEYEKVLEFVIDYYYRDEPLCSIEPKIKPGASDRAENMECLKAGVSIMAVQVKENDEEELVGVNIGVPQYPSCVEEYFQMAKKEGNTKYGQILRLIATASQQSDTFKRYEVDKVLYSFLSCVKPTCRGQNLGTRLKKELMALGKLLGYELVTVDCTSFYSARLCKRMGWDVVNFIAYKNYQDNNGQQVFKPAPPHEGLTTLAMRL